MSFFLQGAIRTCVRSCSAFLKASKDVKCLQFKKQNASVEEQIIFSAMNQLKVCFVRPLKDICRVFLLKDLQIYKFVSLQALQLQQLDTLMIFQIIEDSAFCQ